MAFKMKGFSPFTQKSISEKLIEGAGEAVKKVDIPLTKKDDKKKKETKEQRLTEEMPKLKGEESLTQYGGKKSIQELINDIEDRIEFIGEDVNNGTKTQKEANPIIRKLRRRLGYLRQNKTTSPK